MSNSFEVGRWMLNVRCLLAASPGFAALGRGFLNLQSRQPIWKSLQNLPQHCSEEPDSLVGDLVACRLDLAPDRSGSGNDSHVGRERFDDHIPPVVDLFQRGRE